MRGELVALDLETTGLDPSQDAIIEVGAVCMVNGEITGEFSTLVNPGIPIPTHISHITNIRTQDVSDAPKIETVLPQIRDFVGDRPIIAHNITFDLAFLQGRYHLFPQNFRIDTYDLASVLLPSATRYNLASLAATFDISLQNAHRALDDARATALLYWQLWHKILALPPETVQEIVNLSQGIGWDAARIFEEGLRVMPPSNAATSRASTHTVFAPMTRLPPPLTPVDAKSPVDADAVTSILDEQGTLAAQLSAFEYRPQQLEMAQAVLTAFNTDQHLMVEAGTGTGKSLAYLIPSILWAVKNQRRVVISTHTTHLQDQLLNQDIPAAAAALGITFNASVLKGRGNYLCPRRLMAIRRRRPTSIPELRTMAKILVWLLESDSGDKSEISLRGAVENVIWQRLSAEDEDCTLGRCQEAMQGACPFYKARKAAEAAHVVIVNHALLIADAASGNSVLPEYRHLIVDEAHQLEEAVTHGMGYQIDESALLRRLADLGSPTRGLLGEVLATVRGVIPEKDQNRLEIFIQTIDEATRLMQTHIEGFFKQVHAFLKDAHNARAAEYNTFMRVGSQQRGRSSFAAVQSAWTTLEEYFEVIAEAMHRLAKLFNKLRDYDIPGYEDFIASTDAAGKYLQEVRALLNTFVLEPDSNTIYWLSMGGGQQEMPTIHAAPLHIGPLVEQHLWLKKDSVILTSATLRTSENFSYISERLYADQVQMVEVGSPFDYEASTLVYLPNDVPEPSDKHGYQRAVERAIIELAAALNGRVLVLFTSYAQLRQTSQAIAPRLALGGITVYDQSDGISRQALVDGFKTSEKAVLLGTRSFWEGVDIPGDSLSGLVITRLPFTVPSDPIFAGRSETYSDAFNDYAVPDAVLRFRQGFGRLIRTKADRGVVAVLDSRIINKSYGVNFLESLPECTVKSGSLDQLAMAATEWLKPVN